MAKRTKDPRDLAISSAILEKFEEFMKQHVSTTEEHDFSVQLSALFNGLLAVFYAAEVSKEAIYDAAEEMFADLERAHKALAATDFVPAKPSSKLN